MVFTERKTKLIRNLKTLAIHVNDSVKGYELALGKVPKDSEAANVLLEQRSGRKILADRLNERLTAMGEAGEDRASAEGTAHRALIDLKNWFTGKEETEAILRECIRGEEKLFQYIDDAFDNIPSIDQTSADAINDLKDHVHSAITALEMAN